MNGALVFEFTSDLLVKMYVGSDSELLFQQNIRHI